MSAILLQSCACAAKIVKCSCDATASTNCQDVMIAAIICVTIVAIALIVKCGILIWKGKDLAEKEKEPGNYLRMKPGRKKPTCWTSILFTLVNSPKERTTATGRHWST